MSAIGAYLVAFSRALNEAEDCLCKAFGKATTYSELCKVAHESQLTMSEFEDKRGDAWMDNLDRVLDIRKQEATHEG